MLEAPVRIHAGVARRAGSSCGSATAPSSQRLVERLRSLRSGPRRRAAGFLAPAFAVPGEDRPPARATGRSRPVVAGGRHGAGRAGWGGEPRPSARSRRRPGWASRPARPAWSVPDVPRGHTARTARGDVDRGAVGQPVELPHARPTAPKTCWPALKA